jgi:hypothetical protein
MFFCVVVVLGVKVGDSCSTISCVGDDIGQCVDGKDRIDGTSSSNANPIPTTTLQNSQSFAGGAPNTFECIDDTKFKLFTGNGAFSIGSCPVGFCATRTPPFKNPCVGRANADRIDGTSSSNANPIPTTTLQNSQSFAGGAPNTFECIDDTKFKLFTGNGAFSIGSCPVGFCATRTPPFKNPCVGRANADRIDGGAV